MEHSISILLLIGLLTICSFYIGKASKWVKLPSIIGFMIVGVIAGPSFFDILNEHVQKALSFITQIALAFVALSIGLELSLNSLRKQGIGIVSIIFAESFGAFIAVTGTVFLLTRNIPLALIFGAIAPASAPAGTVAVIQEYRAKGSLTKALYTVVGFDDGLGIIIFGFAAAFARTFLEHEAGGHTESILLTISKPLLEVFLSMLIGTGIAFLYCVLGRRLNQKDIFILTFGTVLVTTGICIKLHLSLILTNMIVGLIVVNTQPDLFVKQIGEEMRNIMPLLFVLFFTLAGANLHINSLPQLGLLGMLYVLARSFGLIGGSRIGALFGKVEDKIRKYVGLGILSQAGVAIGLSLIVKSEFAGVGKVIENIEGNSVTSGDYIGATVITTITATCIFFELIGPVLTKIALTRAGEIKQVKTV